MANQLYHLFVFILGFGAGILTLHLQLLTQELEADKAYERSIEATTQHKEVNVDPYPLPPCHPNRTSAVYIFYGLPLESQEGITLFHSIRSLLKSNFPGTIRVIIDEKVNDTIREAIDPMHRDLLDKIDIFALPLPDLSGKELIPHSNKIRALQAGALIYGKDTNECTVALDGDTYIHPNAPWTKLLSTLELYEISVSHDCDVAIEGVPEFLGEWMPNTGVLALRNTPRVRTILGDWLDRFVPCNATHVGSCTPGTDQYSFLQLAAKHAARLWKLDNSWNCRLTPTEISANITEFPVHSLTVLSNREDINAADSKAVTTCAGYRECHILHSHYLRFP